jgi:tetraacyldisaccharide 4'-kinase
MSIDRLTQDVENVMSGKDNDSVLSKIMAGISKAYGPVMDLRSKLYQNGWLKTHRLPCPVISIGNITLGGTGKTPMTIYLAGLLQLMGFSPAIVCRGYRGKYEHAGGVVTDGVSVFLGPEEAGDEPYLMASGLSGVPVVVGKDRVASGRKAWRSFCPNVIICDDAFQHLRLFRDLNLVLLDAADPVGNGQVFPRGILREPLHHLNRADALIATRAETDKFDKKVFGKKIKISDKPVFRCCHVPDAVSVLGPDGLWEKCDPDEIRGKACTAFSGIARNEDFLRTLNGFGCRVKNVFSFPDHHDFSEKDLETVLRTAQKGRAGFIVTTEKDRVRLPAKMSLPIKIYSLGIRISFVGEDKIRFENFIRQHVELC